MKAIIVTILVAALQGTTATPQQSDVLLDRAEETLSALAEGEFAGVSRTLTPELGRELTPNALAAMWEDVESNQGQFMRLISRLSYSTETGQSAVLLTCSFENGPIDLVVEFDSNNDVADLRFESAAWDVPFAR